MPYDYNFDKFYNSIGGLNDDPSKVHIKALWDLIQEQNEKIEEMEMEIHRLKVLTNND
jgi:hypothetical protein